MTSFGESIAKRRKQLNLTQRQVAAGIKQDDGKPLSVQYLNDIEHGRRGAPPDYIIVQLAKLLHLQLDVLYFVQGACRSTSEIAPFLTIERLQPIAHFAGNCASRKNLKNFCLRYSALILGAVRESNIDYCTFASLYVKQRSDLLDRFAALAIIAFNRCNNRHNQ